MIKRTIRYCSLCPFNVFVPATSLATFGQGGFRVKQFACAEHSALPEVLEKQTIEEHWEEVEAYEVLRAIQRV